MYETRGRILETLPCRLSCYPIWNYTDSWHRQHSKVSRILPLRCSTWKMFYG
jgi:hypothetical protein